MLVYHCASCGHVRQVPDEYAGKNAKCPKCGASNRIEPAKDDSTWAEEMVKPEPGEVALRSAGPAAVPFSDPAGRPTEPPMTYDQGEAIIWYLKRIFWILALPLLIGLFVGFFSLVPWVSEMITGR